MWRDVTSRDFPQETNYIGTSPRKQTISGIPQQRRFHMDAPLTAIRAIPPLVIEEEIPPVANINAKLLPMYFFIWFHI